MESLKAFRRMQDQRRSKANHNLSTSQASQFKLCCDVCLLSSDPTAGHCVSSKKSSREREPLDNGMCEASHELNRVLRELEKSNTQIMRQLDWIQKQKAVQERMGERLKQMKGALNSYVRYVGIIKVGLLAKLDKFVTTDGDKENRAAENSVGASAGEHRKVVDSVRVLMKDCFDKIIPQDVIMGVEELIREVSPAVTPTSVSTQSFRQPDFDSVAEEAETEATSKSPQLQQLERELEVAKEEARLLRDEKDKLLQQEKVSTEKAGNLAGRNAALEEQLRLVQAQLCETREDNVRIEDERMKMRTEVERLETESAEATERAKQRATTVVLKPPVPRAQPVPQEPLLAFLKCACGATEELILH